MRRSSWARIWTTPGSIVGLLFVGADRRAPWSGRGVGHIGALWCGEPGVAMGEPGGCGGAVAELWS